MIFNIQEQKTWDEGFQARLEGDSENSNPYREGTSLASIWLDGWECCQMRMFD